MIRDATVEDIPALLVMGEKFVNAAYSRVGVPFDYESCDMLLRGLIERENGILITNDDLTGMFGAMVHGWHFNMNVKTSTELFWWREEGCKEARDMKRQGEQMAADMGAKTMNMANQEHMRSAALTRLYRMDGYSPSENIFIKELI